jgi:transcriptional regulator
MVPSEIRKGSAELLILGTLEGQARHGYEIARLIEARTDGALEFHSATLYPTLHRLEARGWVTGRWVAAPGQRRRRYYRITAKGRAALREQRHFWRRFLDALTRAARLHES